MNKRLFVSIAVLTLATGGEAWAAGTPQPAGLVLDYNGTNAELAPFSEIRDGAQYTLDGKDTLEFLHYGTCKAVKISGGKLSITRQAYQASGQSREEPGEQCPEEVRIKTAGVGGGVLVRALGVSVVPPNLDCVLVGAKRNAYKAAEIYEGQTLVARLPISGPRLVLTGGTALSIEKDYRLVLKPAAAGAPDSSVGVSVGEAASRCLLRTE